MVHFCSAPLACFVDALDTLPGAIRLLTAGVLDLTPVLEKELGQAISSFADDRLAHYQEMRHSVEGFKTSLQDMATTIASSSEMRPLVLVIDELDRCRPSYAIELLEVAKHLFSVDHIVFILAVNRAELAHSIKAVYGQDFDAQGYLRRIFDLDFRLATPDRGQFIESVLYANRLDDSADSEAIRKVLSDFSVRLISVFGRLLRPFIALVWCMHLCRVTNRFREWPQRLLLF